jgi:hypothetical protein
MPESKTSPAEQELAGLAVTETLTNKKLKLKPQEIPFDHSDSHHYFQPSSELPFVATPSALRSFGVPTIQSALKQLQMLAILHDGLDYLQVFEAEGTGEAL